MSELITTAKLENLREYNNKPSSEKILLQNDQKDMKENNQVKEDKAELTIETSEGHQVTEEPQDDENSLQKLATVLDRERALLRFLIDSIPDLIFYKDFNSVYLGCNKAFEEFAGRTEENLIGLTDLDLFPRETAELFREMDRRMLNQGVANRNEEWVEYPDGRLFFLDTMKTPYYGPQGNVLGLIGVSRDITERIRVEVELQESQHMLSMLMRNLPGMAYRYKNDKKWTTEFVSEGCLKLVGYTAEDLIGNKKLSYNDLILPDHRERVWETWQQSLKGREFFRIEYPIMTANGVIKWVWEQGNGVFSADGEAVALEGLIIDITERKQAEEDLREREYWLKESQRVAWLGSYVYDLRIDRWTSSDVLNEIFGIDKEYVRSFDGWVNLVHSEHRTMMRDYLADTIKNKRDFDKDYKIIRQSDGQEFWVTGLGKFDYDQDGNPVRMYGTIQDVTERKKLEESLRLSSRTDPLTGLLNRRHAMTLIEEEVMRYQRNEKTFSLVIADIDFFKKINDTYGHDCGDAVLRKIAEIFLFTVREVDSVARWGGEEFLIILPETGLTGAKLLAERIRKSIEEHLYWYNQEKISFTMTFGVVVFSGSESIDDLIKQADNCLYEGKRTGRNRVVG